jgi:hypothetical protein
MGIGSILLMPIYTGYFRRRIRKQFNIRASISWDKPFSDIVFRKFPVYWKNQEAIQHPGNDFLFWREPYFCSLLHFPLHVFLGFCAPHGDNGTYCMSAGDQMIMSSFSGHLFDLPSFLNTIFVCPGVIS